MKRVGVIGGVVVLVMLGIAALGTSTSSATVLCKTASNPCTGGTYGKGTTIEASLKTGTKSVLDSFEPVECSSGSIKGEVTNSGGEGSAVSGSLSSFSLGSCSGWEISVLKAGTFKIESPSEGNGVLRLEGLETTAKGFGLHCIYSGPVSLSLKGGEMASLASTASSKLTRGAGRSGAFCGEPTVSWTAEYTVTKPEPLYVEEPSISTVLCKTASNPCTGGTYGKGTAIEASLKTGTKSVIKAEGGAFEIKCEESSLKGEVTSGGGEGAKVLGSLSTLSFNSCGAWTVSTLKTGTFTIEAPKEGNGTLKLEGFEITAEGGGGLHCIYSGSVSVPLKGGEMASVATGGVTLSRTGGRSAAFCTPTGAWSAEYTVTKPEPLYVEEPSISTVLCKTATNPCTGGTYGKGTAIEASLKTGTKSVIKAEGGAFEIKCEESSLKGEVTSGGGEGAKVLGSLSTLSFNSCGAWTVSTLKTGTFTIEAPKEGNGTLKLEGFEITAEGGGLHCIYSGSVSVPLKGGEMASVATGGATLSRTGGRSGASCAESGAWSAEYTVTKPEPLWVESP